MDRDQLKTTTYKISVDDTLLDKQNHITPEVRRIIEELRPDLQKGRKYLIKKLNKLSRQYPRTPSFKNFLSTVYQKNGNIEQAYAVNRWIVKEHPDYLFGKINLATEMLFTGQPEKVPGILGDTMEIGELYPHRKEFHLEEVMGFYTISVHYFLAVDNIEDAEMRLKILNDIDEEHPKTKYANQLLHEWYANKASARLEQEKEQRKEVILKDRRSHLQTTEAPSFHFPEQVSWLYENNLNIDREKIDKILNLDRTKLIQDLEKILHDSIARFNFFVKQVQEGSLKNEHLDFPTHSLLLLPALKSEKSLPAILELLEQDLDFTDFWFGDFVNNLMDNALYHCGRNQTSKLFEFLKRPNIYGMNKALVGEALVKIINDSEEKADFVQAYRQVLRNYIDNATNEAYADTEAIGFVVSNLIDLRYEELLPEVKQLFELDLVDIFISGTYSEVEQDMQAYSYGSSMDFIKKNIHEKYEELSGEEGEFSFPMNEDEIFTEMYNEEILNRSLLNEELNEPVSKLKKIGRNDPCPCGSGKKYKKCCM